MLSDASLSAWLTRAADRDARQCALITPQGAWDFFTLNARVGQLAARYSVAGLRFNQPVAVITQHAIRLAWMMYLSLYVGFTLFPLDPRRPALITLLKNCGIWQVIADTQYGAQLPPFFYRFPSEWLEEPLSTQMTSPSLAPSNNVQLIVATSGTSGTPRGAMLTGNNLKAAVMAARQRLEIKAGDVWLSCLPLFHVGGLSILLRCLKARATVLLHERFEPTQIWGDLQGKRVTHLSLVPAMLARLLEVGADRAPPGQLRYVLVGGSALSPTLAKRAHRAGWPICPTYGLSETASQVATRCQVEEYWLPGDVGKPLDGIRVDIVDEGGRLTTSEGRIRISGPTVMAGYASQKLVSGKGLTGDAYISNDLGYFDEAGNLHVIGRIDDMLISGGETIHPQEVEDQLLCCPGVDDVAVTSQPDETWGQCLIAVVSGSIKLTALRAWCEARLPSFQRPRRFIKTERLPRTSLGKLERQRLKEWFDQT